MRARKASAKSARATHEQTQDFPRPQEYQMRVPPPVVRIRAVIEKRRERGGSIQSFDTSSLLSVSLDKSRREAETRRCRWRTTRGRSPVFRRSGARINRRNQINALGNIARPDIHSVRVDLSRRNSTREEDDDVRKLRTRVFREPRAGCRSAELSRSRFQTQTFLSVASDGDFPPSCSRRHIALLLPGAD